MSYETSRSDRKSTLVVPCSGAVRAGPRRPDSSPFPSRTLLPARGGRIGREGRDQEVKRGVIAQRTCRSFRMSNSDCIHLRYPTDATGIQGSRFQIAKLTNCA